MKILIRNGRVVDPASNFDETCDVALAAGRIVAKVGAEGVYCAGIPGAELGLALKVEDGGGRAAEPALLAVLAALHVLADDELAALERYALPAIVNTRGEQVGTIVARVELEPAA